MAWTIRILILEDNASDAELVKRELRRAGIDHKAAWAPDKAAFLRLFEEFEPDLILADYSVPGFDGLTALAFARERSSAIPVIIVSGAIGEELAIETLKAGATDYVLKQRLGRLGPVVRRAIEEAEQLRDRKRAEEALRDSETALRRSNEDLEQFAYVASHDLQEPLRQVSSFISLLERHLGDRLDETEKEYLDFIKQGALRMHSLINDLLEYSRVGRKGKVVASVDLNETLAKAMENLRVRIRETSAGIVAEKLPAVQGNPTVLMQIFQNLIANALKFRGEQPLLIRVGARLDGDHWLVWVKDNGIGFSQESADKIFMLFQRLDARDRYEGTGIGLAICKRAIEQHGGRIWAVSEPGSGATFYFTLPKI